MTTKRIMPRFVETIPEKLEPELLYVSLQHGSMVHLCACGCGSEVVMPLTPLDWRFTYDGEDISLSPSIGNWSLPCRSHYVVSGGHVRWASGWSDDEIEAGRRHDRRRKEARFGDENARAEPASAALPTAQPAPIQVGIVEWIVSRLRWW